MRFNSPTPNEAVVEVPAGTRVYLAKEFLRSSKFSRDFIPKYNGAFLQRLVSGRLWDLHIDGSNENDILRLSGSDPYGRFEFLEIKKGHFFFIRLQNLAAYSFGKGGRFRRTISLFDPVRWITKTAFGVVVEGPAILLFYGAGIAHKSMGEEDYVFSDQLIGFDAGKKFQVKSLNPDKKSFFAVLMNAISASVCMEFPRGTNSIIRTVRSESISRLSLIPRLIFWGILVAYLIEKLVLKWTYIEV